MTLSFAPFSFICKSTGSKIFYREENSQKLKRKETDERNQDKKAIAADNWYLPHSFGGQCDPPASSRRSAMLAVEHAAASDRHDNIWSREKYP